MNATAPADCHFDAAGVRIRYVVAGRGEPVVLVHSYASDLDRQWIAPGTFAALARTHRVIAFDVRGHGRSGKPHGTTAYGAEMAWDIVRLMDHLAIDQAHVVGYSMGAHVIAQLLTLAPHRLRTATLGGASGRRHWTEASTRQAVIEAQEMEQGLLTAQLQRLLPEDTQRTPAEMRALSAKLLGDNDRFALAAIRRANALQVVTDAQLAQVDVPVLGIAGSTDPYLAGLLDLQRLMRDFTLVVIDGASHMTAAGRPEFVRAIDDFLRDHRADDHAAERGTS